MATLSYAFENYTVVIADICLDSSIKPPPNYLRVFVLYLLMFSIIIITYTAIKGNTYSRPSYYSLIEFLLKFIFSEFFSTCMSILNTLFLNTKIIFMLFMKYHPFLFLTINC